MIQTSSTVGSSRNGCSGPNPETRATSSPTTDGRIGHRGDHSGEAALVVVADDSLGDPPDDGSVALRVDTLAAHGLAHEQIELLHQLPVTVDGRRRHAGPLPR